jgi:glutamate-1-semialdehyde 2,1-aminomutase
MVDESFVCFLFVMVVFQILQWITFEAIIYLQVLAALAETMKKGTSFGAPCLLENVLAEMVISAVPSIEMVRMVNSGTEACMGVLRLARAFTGKERIIKFEGCYHGHADPFLVKAGSGVATLGLPDSPGVPKGATYETLTAPFNDISAVENLFETNKGELLELSLNLLLGTLVSLLLNLNSLMPYAKSLKKMVLS